MWRGHAGRLGRALSLAVTVGALAPQVALPQDVVWQPTGPPGAMTLEEYCTKLKSITVRFFRLEVRSTPNDGGSYEEWNVSFPFAFLVSRVRVKDELPPPHADFAIDMQWTWPSMPHFVFWVGGQESDRWPNPDDSLPEFGILVVRGCPGDPKPPPVKGSAGQPPQTGSVLQHCKRNEDGNRFACYSFSVDLNF